MATKSSGEFFSVCRTLVVPPDVCQLQFSDEPTVRGEHIGDTSRGEMVIIHYNVAGRIVSIELVGDGKPCQENLTLQ